MTVKGYLESARELVLPGVPVSVRKERELATPEQAAGRVLPDKRGAYGALLRRSSRRGWCEWVSLHPLVALVCTSFWVAGLAGLGMSTHTASRLWQILLVSGFVFWGQRFFDGDWPRLAFFKSGAAFTLLSFFLPVWWRWAYVNTRVEQSTWAGLVNLIFIWTLVGSLVLVPAAFVAAGGLGLWLRLKERRVG